MNTLHDLDNSEALAGCRFPLDMDDVARRAVAAKLRRWRCEYECDGRPFTWVGDALSQAQADNHARQMLAERNPDFFISADAVLVACLEQPS